jgi:hypothetical protein
MPECICCKKNEGNITVTGSVIFYICGQSNCKDKKGQDIGQFFLDGSDNPGGNEGNWWLINDHKAFSMNINGKEFVFPLDKRVIKGLKNKIREIVMKQSGIETHNAN